MSAVEVARFAWTDAKRGRQVPVKFYFPGTGDGPFPIIIFSHGLGGTREGYEYLGRYWASHGYVSVHLQHPGSDDAVWREAAVRDRMAAMRKAAADPRNAINRPLDVSLAIDQLEKLNQEKSPFQKRLYLERIGMAGHSFGAFATLAVAGQVFAPGVGVFPMQPSQHHVEQRQRPLPVERPVRGAAGRHGLRATGFSRVEFQREQLRAAAAFPGAGLVPFVGEEMVRQASRKERKRQAVFHDATHFAPLRPRRQKDRVTMRFRAMAPILMQQELQRLRQKPARWRLIAFQFSGPSRSRSSGATCPSM